MFAFLRLTRPLNLLIIVVTMLLMRYGVIGGHLERGLHVLLLQLDVPVERAELIIDPGFGPQMPLPLFVLLVISTILIAAAGNVINDYFDTRIDRINKPGEVIVGRTVKRRVAMTAHLVMSGIGLVLGAFVTWRCGVLRLAVIPAFTIAALWTYSTNFKRQLIIGNLMVALLTALVPLTVGLYEIPMLQHGFAEHAVVGIPNGNRFSMEPSYPELWYWILGFSSFAFLATLARELQKDMADVKGDLAAGCRTIPIVWGMRRAKALVMVHIGLLIVALLAARALAFTDQLSFWYIGVGIIGPLLLSAGFTYNAVTRSEHLRAGSLMKVAMMTGAFFAALIRFLP